MAQNALCKQTGLSIEGGPPSNVCI